MNNRVTGKLPTGAGRGDWGEGGSKAGYRLRLPTQYREALPQRLPPADFFGYFLVRRQESNIPRAYKNLLLFVTAFRYWFSRQHGFLGEMYPEWGGFFVWHFPLMEKRNMWYTVK